MAGVEGSDKEGYAYERWGHGGRDKKAADLSSTSHSNVGLGGRIPVIGTKFKLGSGHLSLGPTRFVFVFRYRVIVNLSVFWSTFAAEPTRQASCCFFPAFLQNAAFLLQLPPPSSLESHRTMQGRNLRLIGGLKRPERPLRRALRLRRSPSPERYHRVRRTEFASNFISSCHVECSLKTYIRTP